MSLHSGHMKLGHISFFWWRTSHLRHMCLSVLACSALDRMDVDLDLLLDCECDCLVPAECCDVLL